MFFFRLAKVVLFAPVFMLAPAYANDLNGYGKTATPLYQLASMNDLPRRYVRLRSVDDFRRAFQQGENRILLLALMKRSYERGTLRGLSIRQQTLFRRLKFSNKTQALMNGRDGFNRLFSHGLSGFLAEMAKPGSKERYGGGRRQQDLAKKIVGTLYEGELIILTPTGMNFPRTFAVTIDYPENVLKNFFVGYDQYRASDYSQAGQPMADNLVVSDQIDFSRLREVPLAYRRQGASQNEGQQFSERMHDLMDAWKVLSRVK